MIMFNPTHREIMTYKLLKKNKNLNLNILSVKGNHTTDFDRRTNDLLYSSKRENDLSN